MTRTCFKRFFEEFYDMVCGFDIETYISEKRNEFEQRATRHEQRATSNETYIPYAMFAFP